MRLGGQVVAVVGMGREQFFRMTVDLRKNTPETSAIVDDRPSTTQRRHRCRVVDSPNGQRQPGGDVLGRAERGGRATRLRGRLPPGRAGCR